MPERHRASGRHRRHSRTANQPLFAVGAVAAVAMAVPGVQNATQPTLPAQAASDAATSPGTSAGLQKTALSDAQTKKAGLDLVIAAQARIATDRKVSAMRGSRSAAKREVPTKVVTKKRAVTAVLPISSSRFELTAEYGQWGRMWSSGRHTGQDFAAPMGTTVRSVTAGTVVEAGWAGAYGYRVVVKHSDGRYSTYSHLSRILRSSGSVKTGEAIGRVGSTGNSTGPHLHFEVLNSAHTPIGPLTYLRSKGIKI